MLGRTGGDGKERRDLLSHQYVCSVSIHIEGSMMIACKISSSTCGPRGMNEVSINGMEGDYISVCDKWGVQACQRKLKA